VNRKSDITDLAIFGAEPAFQEPLHVGKPCVIGRERFLDRLNNIFERRLFTNNGPYLQEFEHAIAASLGVDHCVAVTNATLGLALLVGALDLSGEVIMPSFTFAGTPHALKWQKIEPVFCDVDLQTQNIDPEQVSQLITQKTTAILGVHLWGRPCDIESLQEIANYHQLKLVFDAAHGFGCTYQGTPLGRFGAGEVFSFHATKFLHTFEGGAITTNDEELADRLRCMRNFGFNSGDGAGFLGINAKMTEISAAMGLTNMDYMKELVAKNYENYCVYKKHLDGFCGLKLIDYDDHEKNNFQYVVIEFDEHLAGEKRDRIITAMHAEGILVKRYFYPGCHRRTPYRLRSEVPQGSLTNTELLTDRIAVLPTGYEIGRQEVNLICKILQLCVSNYDNLTMQMDLRGIQSELFVPESL